MAECLVQRGFPVIPIWWCAVCFRQSIILSRWPPTVASFSFSFSLCCVCLGQCHMVSYQLLISCIFIRICFISILIHFCLACVSLMSFSCRFHCFLFFFFVWGFTFFFVIFASRMKTLSCTFVCSGAHAYFDSNTFTSTVPSIASMSDALSDTSGTTPSHKGNLLFLLSSSFFWTSSGVFSLNL